ncbi:transporter associated domain-containing protein [Histidinibacterium lentulum]|uniref:CBS domain-containing protein n=1 Tax=Histidinibacterium lentulum TaxID=2480588 RepID=A0A3N2R7Z7_9RHOB|nr:transporter associated domain-containing protein [Histidinibacterium lentulum]ROU03565.1 CBS domain-containing protein [Histidinibacterium lentulum]
MGDSTEGSSRAAHGAPSDPDSSGESRGLFARLFDSLSPATAPLTPMNGHHDVQGMSPVPGLASLRQLRVEDVSVPEADIRAVPVSASKEELLKAFRTFGKTRLPVFDGTLDTPVGLVHLKDFALKHGFNGNGEAFDLRAILRPLLYVPPSMPLSVLLQKMQTERIHMALVIDEYGGTDGLVTIEDLLEQVVGEIEDEHDIEEAKLWTKESADSWLVRAKTPLDEFEAEIGLALTEHEEIDEEEIDTLGGLVFMLAGRVPARGEVVQHPSGIEFDVIDADPRRIKRMRVRLPGKATG